MPTLGEVKRWNAGVLDQIATTLRQRQQMLVHSGDAFTRALPVPGWSGQAADQASAQHKTLTTWLDQAVGGVAIVGKSLAQASDAIPAVQTAIGNAEELAARYGFLVGEDGMISDRYAGTVVPPELHPEDRLRIHRQIADEIAQALRTATDIDNDLASVFQRAQRGDFGADAAGPTEAAAAGTADPGLTLPDPPPAGTPAQNAGWWASLSPAGQAILAKQNPAWLGNLDGIPAATRTAINQNRIGLETTALTAQLNDATARNDTSAVNTLQAKLDSVKAVESTMRLPGRQLLTLDTTGKRAKAVVAVGDVDRAEHVAVFTPGLTSTVDGSLEGYDRNMYDLQRKAQNLADNHGDGGKVATVTWIGYDAPQLAGLVNGEDSVASDHLAQVGAPKLTSFLNGVGATHDVADRPLHLTALGHSYGSLTTGVALHQDTPVKDAVVFGSPGMDAEQRSDLHVPQGHLYAEWANGDPVPLLNSNFGVSPYEWGAPSDPLKDVHELATGDAVDVDGKPLTAVYGHTDYLEERSTSQYNMGVIVAGRPDLRIKDD
ncbi:alpha/beta hydrolase [Pseudonocardia spinosispora]|uniref:alpha/beta hydrolase n=1 Tax=Pseudonocardia spinosispora TaxID=103441 RepID=UPI0004069C53|nr:alpha/beta hydrolase [Pseudonocardia spinosispora]